MPNELKVCSKCHLELPIASFTVTDHAKGWRKAACKSCEAARVRAYYAANPDYRAKTKANSVKWQKANPVKAAVITRKRELRRKYGLSPDQYAALLASQSGACALCGATEHGHNHNNGRHARLPGGHASNWPIDHCHKDGRVRGLLCHTCNAQLGGYESLLDRLGEAAVLDYLTRPSPVLALPPPAPAEPDVRETARFVAELPPRYTRGQCSVCGADQHANGLCFKHYMRARRNGDAGPVENLPRGTVKGATHHKASLTEEQARAIKFSTDRGADLARRFNVKPSVVSSIRHGLTWKHLQPGTLQC